jgi:hypothetical protein
MGNYLPTRFLVSPSEPIAFPWVDVVDDVRAIIRRLLPLRSRVCLALTSATEYRILEVDQVIPRTTRIFFSSIARSFAGDYENALSAIQDMLDARLLSVCVPTGWDLGIPALVSGRDIPIRPGFHRWVGEAYALDSSLYIVCSCPRSRRYRWILVRYTASNRGYIGGPLRSWELSSWTNACPDGTIICTTLADALGYGALDLSNEMQWQNITNSGALPTSSHESLTIYCYTWFIAYTPRAYVFRLLYTNRYGRRAHRDEFSAAWDALPELIRDGDLR